MVDAIVWADKLPDIIKKWILIIPMILAAIGSGSGIYQYFDKKEVMKKADIELEGALEQTAVIAEHLGKYVPEKKVIQKDSCNWCRTEIKKLKRWHE